MALAVGAAVYALAGREGTPSPVSPRQAQAAATESCRSLARFEELVRLNAPVDQVQEVLDAAVRRAEVAARGEPRWLALAGGAQSVQLALDADDARAARVGIDVVRAECRRAGAGF